VAESSIAKQSLTNFESRPCHAPAVTIDGGGMKNKRIETFDDWKDVFHMWQKDINYDTALFDSVLQGYEFTERFAEPKHTEIEFGEFSPASVNIRTNATA
jgi:hypothetical protein